MLAPQRGNKNGRMLLFGCGDCCYCCCLVLEMAHHDCPRATRWRVLALFPTPLGRVLIIRWLVRTRDLRGEGSPCSQPLGEV